MKSEIKKSVDALKKGEVIIYPTDTIWGIGCDATDEIAVDKVFQIKKRHESKSLIILVNGMPMLYDYISKVPGEIKKILKNMNKPTTVIYDHPMGLAPNAVAMNDTVAIRIVENGFCSELIDAFGKPLVSTSANISGQPAPSGFEEIDPLLLKKADYIVNLPAIETKKSASQIIKVNDLGEIEFLRK